MSFFYKNRINQCHLFRANKHNFILLFNHKYFTKLKSDTNKYLKRNIQKQINKRNCCSCFRYGQTVFFVLPVHLYFWGKRYKNLFNAKIITSICENIPSYIILLEVERRDNFSAALGFVDSAGCIYLLVLLRHLSLCSSTKTK